MKRVLAVSSVAALLLAASCSESDDASPGTVSVATTAEEVTTTAETTTTTEAETTTSTTDPLTEAAVTDFMMRFYSFEWDEETFGIGHVAEERFDFFADPVLERNENALVDRTAANRFRRGSVTGDLTSIDISGNEAIVMACVTDGLGLYEADGAEVIPPDDFSLVIQYQLRYEGDTWKIYEFLIGEECQR